MAGLQKITGTNTLKTGFMDIFNGDVDEIIDATIVENDGLVKLVKHGGGYILLDLRPFFYTKTQTENLVSTPLATESTFGKVKRATEEDAINGLDDIKYMSSANTHIKIVNFFENATSIGENAEEFLLGGAVTLVKALGGSLQIGASPGNLFYDFSDIDGETGDFVNAKLGYNGDLFQIRNDLGVEGRLNVGVDFSIERVNPSGDIFQNLISSTEDIVFDSPKTIINNVLEANQIGGIGSSGVTAINNWVFNSPITIAPPTAPNHAVTQSYVLAALDAAMNGGNRLYGFVYAAATTNITLSGSQVVDGVTPPNGEKVLLPEQTDKTKNGIWIVNTSGAWTRATDFLDVDGYGNVQVSVITGVANASAVFVCDIKTVITIDTTEVTFTKIYQPFAQQYIAYRTAGNSPQQFYGTHIFEDKIKGQNPTENDDLANKAYVDLQDTILSNTINNTINSLSTVYWGRISGNGLGIGTTSTDAFNLYQNNARRATINGSSMLGLGYMSIANGAFSGVYSTNGIGNYGLTVAKSIHFGYMTGNTIETPTFDVSIGYGSGDAFYRFGKWNAGGFYTEFHRGIQYDSNNNLHIGTFTQSTGVNNGKILADGSKITITPDGKIGAGIAPTEKLHIDGNFLLTGVIKPSGNAPTADEQFLVSNSTTGNKYINYNPFGKFQGHEDFSNVADAPFGASFVYGNGTDATGLPNNTLQGHVIKMGIGTGYPDQYTMLAFGRPFGTYYNCLYLKGVYDGATTDWIQIGGDVRTYTEEIGEANEVLRGIYYEEEEDTKQAFVGIKGVTGDLILRLNVENEGDSTIKQYNNIMSTADGRLYYQSPDGDTLPYLLAGEGGSGTGGVIYTFEEPIYPDGTNIKIRRANNSTTGVLTSTDWTRFDGKQDALGNASASITGKLLNTDWSIFNNKLGQGSTVAANSFLNFEGEINFNRNPNSTQAEAKVFFENSTLKIIASTDNHLQLNGNVVKVFGTEPYTPEGATVADIEISQPTVKKLVKINGSRLNFYNGSTPSDGAKFVLQYDASVDAYFMKPA